MSQSNKRAYPQRRPAQERPEAQRPRSANPAPVRSANARTGGRMDGTSARTAPVRSANARTGGRMDGTGAKSSPVRTSPRFSGGLGLFILLGVIAVIASYFLQRAWPNGFPLVKREAGQSGGAPAAVTEIHTSGPIRINEIMTSNGASLSAADGSMPDWIEIINTGRSSMNLQGWKLAKTANSVSVFTFPDQMLAPNECVLIYADSRLRDAAGEEYHAPFRLSSSGDTLMLFNDSGSAVDTVNIPALQKDHSYARKDNRSWIEEQNATPGLDNTPESYRMLTQKSENSPVIITELMASNGKTLADENGLYLDYIELYNRSGNAISLAGWYLSDDPQVPRKWRFPDVTISAGEYLTVFASGLDRRDNPSQLHTSFSLSSEGESVALCNAQGQMMDVVNYGLLKKDQAWSLQGDGSWTVAAGPTPGKAN